MFDYTRSIDEELSTLVEATRRSLVQVSGEHRGTGAGTVWHRQGLVVTNAHVLGRRPRGNLSNAVQVTLSDGRTVPAQTLAVDYGRDLAALKVDAGDLPTIELGESRALQSGQWVVAVGHPWGVRGAITAGVVIGFGPPWAETGMAGPAPSGGSRSQSSDEPAHEYILVSLHLRPGHSGGPLVDARGRLVGINTMINGPDVGLAVPVDDVRTFLRAVLKT